MLSYVLYVHFRTQQPVATCGYFNLNQLTLDFKKSSSWVTLTSFHVRHSYMCLGVTFSDSANIDNISVTRVFLDNAILHSLLESIRTEYTLAIH